MGQRRSIAVTIAAVVVFASLVTINLTLFYSENERLRYAAIAQLEESEVVNGKVLIAQAGYSALGEIQNQLVANAPRCTSWSQYANSIRSSHSYSGVKDSVSYHLVAEADYEESGPAADNLSLVSPFDGYADGSLNLKFSLSLQESAAGLPSYAREEVHHLHISVSLSRSLSLCLSFLTELGEELGSSVCSRSEMESSFDALTQKYVQLANSYGLSFVAHSTLAQVDGCWTMYYDIRLSETSEGVSGKFSWYLFDSGSS